MRKVISLLLFLSLNVTLYSQDIDKAINLFTSGKYSEAVEIFEKSLPEIRKEYGKLDTSYYAPVLLYTAACYDNLQDKNKAKKYYLTCADIYETLNIQNNEVYATALNNLALIYNNEYNYNKAEEILRRVKETYEIVYGKESDMAAIAANNIGLACFNQGKYDEAEKFYAEAVNIYKALSLTENPNYLVAVINLATTKYYKAEYDSAEKLYLDIKDKMLKADFFTYYFICLNNIALIQTSKGNYKKAEEYYGELIKSQKKTIGENNSDFALTLNNLGYLYYNSGEYKKAEEYYLKSKGVYESANSIKNPNYQALLSNLGLLYNHTNESNKAKEVFENYIKVCKKTYGKNSAQYATALSLIAAVYMKEGNYEKAENIYNESKDIYSEISGNESQSYATILNNLGLIYSSSGNYQQAEDVYKEVLNIREKTGGRTHPDYAAALNNLAEMYRNKGDYKKAENLYIDAIKIQEDNKLTNTLYYPTYLNNLGLFYQNTGDYNKAENYIRKASDKFKEILGEESVEYAKTLNNIGMFYYHTGNFKESEKFYKKALAIYKKVWGDEHPDYLLSLNNLGELYRTVGNYDDAKELFSEAKNKIGKNLGKSHPHYGIVLNNLALIHYYSGGYAKAESLYLEAKDIAELKSGKESPYYILALNNLAELYRKKGDIKNAEEYYLEALSTSERTISKDHPNYLLYLNNISLLYASTNQLQKAKEKILEANELLKNTAKKSAYYMSEKDREIYLQTHITHYFHVYNSFYLKTAGSDKELISHAYNNSLFNKSLLLNSAIAMKKFILNSGDSILVNLYKKHNELGKIISEQSVLPQSKQREDLSQINEEFNNTEKELARKSSEYKDLSSNLNHNKTWLDIKKSLKPEEAAIEFVKFNYFKNSNFTDSVLYYALIVTSECKYPESVFLFEESELSELLKKEPELKTKYPSSHEYKYIKSIYDPSSKKSKQIYSLAFKPIASKLSKHKTIYMSPVGILNKVSFDAMPLKKDTLVSDKFNIFYTGNTGNILIREKLLPDEIKKTILFGGIQYDIPPLKMKKNILGIASKSDVAKYESFNRGNEYRSGDVVWKYLPGSLKEVSEIENLLKKSKYKYTVYTNEDGTEEKFKNLENDAPTVLHISTHGFYYPEKENTPKDLIDSEKSVYIYSDNPLIRSGLILAGGQFAFNRKEAVEGIEDGVLTAIEVSRLNLFKTKLAVLSACQTGLGEVKGDEGVYGLQRAFKMAGVDYLLISLWEVPDKTTQELMTEFYKNWFEGNDIREAFKKAQNYLKNKYSDVPGSAFAWAAFVLIN